MDMGVRLALSNPGAFGESEGEQSRGHWVRASQNAQNRGSLGEHFEKLSKMKASLGEKFPKSRGHWVRVVKNRVADESEAEKGVLTALLDIGLPHPSFKR